MAVLLVLSASATAQDATDGGGIVESTAGGPTPDATISYTLLGVQAVVAALAIWIVYRKRLYRPVPGRLTPAEPMPVIPPVLLMFGAILVFLANLMGSLSAAALLKPVAGATSSLRDSNLGMLGHYTGFVVGMLVLSVMIPHVCRAIGLRFRAGDAARGVGAALVVIPIVMLVAALGTMLGDLIHAQSVERTAHEGLMKFVLSNDNSMKWLFGALVVVAAPIAEEVIYRGLIQSAFLRASRSAPTAIIAASAVFTFMHVSVVSWHALPALFVLSVALGISAERTKGLTAPIVIHAVFNLFNLMMALWGAA